MHSLFNFKKILLSLVAIVALTGSIIISAMALESDTLENATATHADTIPVITAQPSPLSQPDDTRLKTPQQAALSGALITTDILKSATFIEVADFRPLTERTANLPENLPANFSLIPIDTDVESDVDEVKIDEPSVSAPPAINYDEVKLLPSVQFDAAIQRQIFEDVCAGDPEKFIMLIAVGKQETTGFNANAIGDNGNAFGWLQIHPYWHWNRMAKHGIYTAEDLLDPVKCAYVGLDYLEEIKNARLYVTTMTREVYVVYNAGHLTSNSVVVSRANNVMYYYAEYTAEFAANNPNLLA